MSESTSKNHRDTADESEVNPDSNSSASQTSYWTSLPPRSEHRIHEYWSWISVALFLLVTVDLLTSLYAAAVVGVEAESNPFMEWLLGQDLTIIVGVNLLAVVLVAVGFAGVIAMLRRTPDPYARYFALGIELWLGLLLAVGLFVFANNLFVIVHGVSLA